MLAPTEKVFRRRISDDDSRMKERNVGGNIKRMECPTRKKMVSERDDGVLSLPNRLLLGEGDEVGNHGRKKHLFFCLFRLGDA